MSYTEGPWHWKRGTDQMCSFDTTVVSIPTGHETRLFVFSVANDWGDREDDARLIAAAPELLEALQKASELAWGEGFDVIANEFDTVIRKAIGE